MLAATTVVLLVVGPGAGTAHAERDDAKASAELEVQAGSEIGGNDLVVSLANTAETEVEGSGDAGGSMAGDVGVDAGEEVGVGGYHLVWSRDLY